MNQMSTPAIGSCAPGTSRRRRRSRESESPTGSNAKPKRCCRRIPAPAGSPPETGTRHVGHRLPLVQLRDELIELFDEEKRHRRLLMIAFPRDHGGKRYASQGLSSRFTWVVGGATRRTSCTSRLAGSALKGFKTLIHARNDSFSGGTGVLKPLRGPRSRRARREPGRSSVRAAGRSSTPISVTCRVFGGSATRASVARPGLAGLPASLLRAWGKLCLAHRNDSPANRPFDVDFARDQRRRRPEGQREPPGRASGGYSTLFPKWLPRRPMMPLRLSTGEASDVPERYRSCRRQRRPYP